jgi:hypothetical protein
MLLVKPMRESIDSHLDSLITGIYLETKGVNLGITMKMLKEVFIRIAKKGGINKEHILTDTEFEELRKSIKRCIKLKIKERNPQLEDELSEKSFILLSFPTNNHPTITFITQNLFN